MKNTSVYLSACDSYEYQKIRRSVDAIFESLSLDELIQPGMKVTIKPNLLMRAKAETAIITHPLITAAVGTKLQELGADVLIAESSGGPYNTTAIKAIYNGCGYEAMSKEFGLKLNYDCGHQMVAAPHGKRCRSFAIIDPIAEADLIVDIAKLKSHCMTVMSGAVKNLFGTVPGLLKPELHCRFPEKPAFGEMLVDLCETVKPRIVIVDAIEAMEGNGPSGGKPRHIGAILGGRDPYCVDLVGARLIQMLPSEIYMLQSAIDRKLCPESLEQLTLLGDPLEQFIVEDFLQPESKSTDFITRIPKFLQPIVHKLMTPKPKIRTKDCIGCGKCAESCPQHTMRIENRKASIDYRSCIKCYCCHEMCPVQAIDIQRLRLFSL